jgi:hypothetical protein
MKNNPCTGCKWYIKGIQKNFIGCQVVRWGVHHKCPCRDCLIKVMCGSKHDCAERMGFGRYWRIRNE